MSEVLDRIEDRTLRQLERLEWTLSYKRLLLDRCLINGERDLAVTLSRDIHELEAEAHFHKVASVLLQVAR